MEAGQSAQPDDLPYEEQAANPARLPCCGRVLQAASPFRPAFPRVRTWVKRAPNRRLEAKHSALDRYTSSFPQSRGADLVGGAASVAHSRRAVHADEESSRRQAGGTSSDQGKDRAGKSGWATPSVTPFLAAFAACGSRVPKEPAIVEGRNGAILPIDSTGAAVLGGFGTPGPHSWAAQADRCPCSPKGTAPSPCASGRPAVDGDPTPDRDRPSDGIPSVLRRRPRMRGGPATAEEGGRVSLERRPRRFLRGAVPSMHLAVVPQPTSSRHRFRSRPPIHARRSPGLVVRPIQDPGRLGFPAPGSGGEGALNPRPNVR